MAPFLPVLALSRSQNIRIGRSPNAVKVPELALGDAAGTNPQSGALAVPAYVDLGDSWSRRDLQHHMAIGALLTVGSISDTVTSDLFATAEPTVTAGTGALTVTIGDFTLESRTYGNTLAVTGKTLTLTPNTSSDARIDRVVVDEAGNLSVIEGTPAATPAAPATPANKTTVATVDVPANATSTTAPTSATADAPTS